MKRYLGRSLKGTVSLIPSLTKENVKLLDKLGDMLTTNRLSCR